MKLASLKHGRDGRLVVVSRDLTRCAEEGGVGYSCIAELRAVETIRVGSPKTPFLKFGDRVRIEMNDRNGARSSGRSSRPWSGLDGAALLQFQARAIRCVRPFSLVT